MAHITPPCNAAQSGTSVPTSQLVASALGVTVPADGLIEPSWVDPEVVGAAFAVNVDDPTSIDILEDCIVTVAASGSWSHIGTSAQVQIVSPLGSIPEGPYVQTDPSLAAIILDHCMTFRAAAGDQVALKLYNDGGPGTADARIVLTQVAVL